MTTELVVPTSLYGVALAEPTAANKEVDGLGIYLVAIGSCYVLLFLNFFLQIYFLLQIWVVDAERIEAYKGCDDGLFLMQLACVFTFEVSVFLELRHSVNLFRLLWNIHTVRTSPRYLTAAMREEGGGGAVRRDNRWFTTLTRPITLSPDIPQWSLEGISRPYKIFSMAFVVLPKLMICLLLGFAGGVYIARTDSVENMILNTLAVNFVVEIDEMLYEAFTSDTTKMMLENMKTVQCEVSEREQLTLFVANRCVFPTTTVLATCVLVNSTSICRGEPPAWLEWALSIAGVE